MQPLDVPLILRSMNETVNAFVVDTGFAARYGRDPSQVMNRAGRACTVFRRIRDDKSISQGDFCVFFESNRRGEIAMHARECL